MTDLRLTKREPISQLSELSVTRTTLSLLRARETVIHLVLVVADYLRAFGDPCVTAHREITHAPPGNRT
ncbi:hypothetical protein D3C72_2027940 [compost metagenome]